MPNLFEHFRSAAYHQAAQQTKVSANEMPNLFEHFRSAAYHQAAQQTKVSANECQIYLSICFSLTASELRF